MAEEHRVEIPHSQVTIKTVVTVAATLLAVVAAVFVLLNARLALIVTAIATVLAVALNHAVEWLCRLRLPRGLAITVVVLLLLGLFVGFGFLFVPPTIEQIGALVRSIPDILERLRGWHLFQAADRSFNISERLEGAATSAPNYAQEALDTVVKAISRIVTAAGAALTVFVLIVFMLLFGGSLVRRLLGEATPARRERYERVLRNIYRSLGGYIGGLAIVVGVNAAATTTYLAILRIPYFLPLGVLSGLSSLIPLVGNTLAGILITLITLVTGGLWRAVGTAIFFVVYQQWENHILGPLVYRHTVHINPLVGLLALLVLSELAGIAGTLISIPMVAVAQVILRELLAFRRERLNLPPIGPVGSPRPPPRLRFRAKRRKEPGPR